MASPADLVCQCLLPEGGRGFCEGLRPGLGTRIGIRLLFLGDGRSCRGGHSRVHLGQDQRCRGSEEYKREYEREKNEARGVQGSPTSKGSCKEAYMDIPARRVRPIVFTVEVTAGRGSDALGRCTRHGVTAIQLGMEQNSIVVRYWYHVTCEQIASQSNMHGLDCMDCHRWHNQLHQIMQDLWN